MIDLTNIDYVKELQSNLRTQPLSDKNIMAFLEKLCAWYDLSDLDTNSILIRHGKRQVLATIKTLIKKTPEQVVQIAKGER